MKRKIWTQVQRENKSRDWDDAAASQGLMEGRIFLLQISAGTYLCQHLDFDLQNCDTINFCCFKSPREWYFIMAALGN